MSGGADVDAALRQAQRGGVARLDAQLLLAHLLGRPRSWLLAHGDAALEVDLAQRYAACCARRAAGEPLAYLLGAKEFRGLSLAVDRRVLVPRPETEILVDWALERLAELPGPARVADLGTGSGAVALAIAAACPGASVCAVEIDEGALALARANGDRLAIAVQWLQGDWWGAVAGRRFDLVVANPPYVAAADPHLPALRHEPRIALVSGDDGLAALRAIASGALLHLAPGGWLLLEHGCDQGDAVRRLLREAGLEEVQTRVDLAHLPRCSGGRAAGAAIPRR